MKTIGHIPFGPELTASMLSHIRFTNDKETMKVNLETFFKCCAITIEIRGDGVVSVYMSFPEVFGREEFNG